MTTRRHGPISVETSNEGKVLFPDAGLTKGDLVDYYERIAETILPHMRGRPVVMQRFPDGIDAEGFYHKDIPDHFPDWIERVEAHKEGGSVTHVVCENTATLVYLANQGCVTPHIWLSRRDDIERPDRIVLDLDPSHDNFGDVRSAARLVGDALEDRGLTPFFQLTGSRGVHVVAPITRGPTFDQTRSMVRALAADLAHAHPEALTIEQRKSNREGRVYLDTARNAYAQTIAPPYAVRPRPGAPVATPIDRDELSRAGLTPDRYTIRTIFRRLGQREDPWKGIQHAARRAPTAPTGRG